MVGGKSGDPHVHLLLADLFHDTTILRYPTLGDIQVRHDLDAGKNGQGEVDGRGGHFVKRAIDAIADLELFLEGFEVDVRCLFLDRLVEDEIDVADDGR